MGCGVVNERVVEVLGIGFPNSCGSRGHFQGLT